MAALIERVSRGMALLGGLVLVALVALTTVSIAGRLGNTLGHSDFVENALPALADALKLLGPINGDYELVEAGVAIAIFAFFPWCFLNRGNATVDIFTAFLPLRAQNALGALWEAVFLVAMGVITWRLYVGMSDKMRYGETTFQMEMPVWWGYAICAALSLVATLTCAWMVYLRVAETLAGGDAGRGSAGH
jgi:hypothetical protein